MSAAAGRLHLAPQQIFQAFKYFVFLLLGANIFLFLGEEWEAARHLMAGEPSLNELVPLFAQTIDTVAWVALLLLFELETFVIPEERIRGRLKLALHGVRAFCYLFIVYAFYGYLSKYLALLETIPIAVPDACALAGAASYLLGGDEFVAVSADNCLALPFAPEMHELISFEERIVADTANLVEAQRLALTDVINAGDWLIVVMLLEIDVRLELRGLLSGWRRWSSEGTKVLLYAVLLGCAIYWWLEGSFLDFWDAFLWLIAFVFIELNLFEWHDQDTVRRS
jgi:hypothetical protein